MVNTHGVGEQLNRREVLKASAAAPGLGILKDQSFSLTGSKNFTEAALVIDNVPERVPRLTREGFKRYWTSNGNLFITGAAPKQEIKNIKSAKKIIKTPNDTKNEGGKSIAAKPEFANARRGNPQNDNKLSNKIPCDVGAELTDLDFVIAEDSEDLPSFTTKFKGRNAKVRVNGEKHKVKSGESKSITLPDIRATFKVRGEKVVEKPDHLNPDETTLVREGDTEKKVTLTPTLIVRNHGKVKLKTPEKTLWDN